MSLCDLNACILCIFSIPVLQLISSNLQAPTFNCACIEFPINISLIFTSAGSVITHMLVGQ